MTTTLILWAHALAALCFAGATLAAWRRPDASWPRSAFAAALLLSALWALAVAGIGPRDLATRSVEALRNLTWLGFAFLLVRRDRSVGWTLAAVYLVVGGVVVTGIGLALAAAVTREAGVAELETALLVFRMMAAAGALVLARHLYGASPERGAVRPIAVALALLWGADLLLFGAAWGQGWNSALVAGRGAVAVGAALLFGLAAQRRDGWALAVSRPAATRALIAVALVVYLGLVACLSAAAGAWGGTLGRAWQAGIVIGAGVALATLLSTSWLGAWAKVKLAKHLFRHRYDYRVEWQRFTATLATEGEPLAARVIAAVANLLDAPAGMLLLPDGVGLSVASGWQWSVTGEAGAALTTHLIGSRGVIELDPLRSEAASAGAPVVPGWIVREADAWAIVPLVHGDALAGAVLLARPPVPRALDWEDFDLLRVAGRQAASYLAEDRAHRALAQAERFEEFNRRFAFILHDIKNLVSQQLLVARNAERHADNPAFRADMVATLNESAERMTTLLARLSLREPAPAQACEPVDCATLVQRVARRSPRPVTCTGAGIALAHPQRLEQVIAHLVQNASEASTADAPVFIAVAVGGPDEDGRVAIEVEDRGTGMTPAFVRDELFRPFASTKPGGFGLGAFEARQLVVAMGGTLTATSREGEGSCFRIDLPAAQALEKAA